MAQSNVFSLNVVGYVNTKLVGGGAYNMVANPLNNSNNNITNIFQNVPDGSSIFRWDPTVSDFQSTTYTYAAGAHVWDNGSGNFSGFILNPGEGIFFINNGGSDITNTFVGDVIQGSYTNSLVGGGSYNGIGSSAPLGGSFTNSIAGLAAADGDTVDRWDVVAQDLDGNTPTYDAVHAVWSSDAIVAPGEGFFYIRNGGNVQWIRNFTVQ